MNKVDQTMSEMLKLFTVLDHFNLSLVTQVNSNLVKSCPSYTECGGDKTIERKLSVKNGNRCLCI